jgi:NAD(P)H-hydrate epimerase
MPEFVADIPRLAPRAPLSHKGDYGRALLVGGSRGMSGAVALAGMATLRSGAGLVTLAVPNLCLETVAGWEPSYMTLPLPCDAEGRLAEGAREVVTNLASKVTAMACGPGLGRSDALTAMVCHWYHALPLPLVIDADGLNALAQHPSGLETPAGPRILTPHPGEFDRLVGQHFADWEERACLAEQWAAGHGVVMVLKGHRTLVTDGRRSARNETGNPGMATGGSGDVLTGIITALLCQGLSPWEAARLGVHVHGLAGDLAAAQFSPVAMIARDIIGALPRAWRQLP